MGARWRQECGDLVVKPAYLTMPSLSAGRIPLYWNRQSITMSGASIGYMSEGILGNRITNGVIRWRSRLRSQQSKTLLGLEWDEAEMKEVTR